MATTQEALTFSFGKASPAVGAEVRKGVEQRRALFRERDQIMHAIRRYRLMRHKPALSKVWARRLGQLAKLPIMYRLVQTGVTAMAKDYPTIYTVPLALSDKGAADDEARSLNLLVQTVNRMQHNRYLYNIYFNLLGDGLGVTKTQQGRWNGFPLPEDDELDDDYASEVAAYVATNPLPFYTSVVNPLTFYPPTDDYGEDACVESAYRDVRATLKALNLMAVKTSGGALELNVVPDGVPYPEWEFPVSTPSLQRVDEVWTKDACFIITKNLGGDVWQFDNPSGEVPYSWAFADPTGVTDPMNIGMSICYPLYFVVPHIDSLVNHMMAWSQFMAPTPYTTQDPNPMIRSTQETTIENFEPGMLHNLPTGRKFGVVQAPDMGQPALSFLNFLLGVADKGGLPSHIAGDISGSRLPALTLQFAYEAGIQRLKPASQSAGDLIGQTLGKARRIIADIGADIPVNGWEMGDSETKTRGWDVVSAAESAKGRQIIVELEADSVQDEIAKGTHANFMATAGPGRPPLWSIRRAMKFAGVKDPEDELAEIGADMAMAQAMPLQARQTLENDPDLGPIFQQVQAEQAAANGQPPAPGAPVPAGPGAAAPAPANGAAPQPTNGGTPGPGRNREGVPAGRGGGRRGINPTEHPRGNRGSPVGRT